ncbi:carbonic anhydrase [Corynebacterium felinum]|uniref:Carbonic anhydrase n=1 Tax=Corynebacterium felinum TaxID=131318 RepID=A0ABU2B7P4_9CORY|nr:MULTISPECIES: carbonic anhydrase [Corynebacterium]MDF5821452.1 carbonic anhydrase [Corynebacterium felinum]MDO4762379.1 carbonic anhydrase [Corynebacterium sp.]MDR7353803.1 carbonic anhydrase [Corynebacterium felinum]WJY95982.1 Carbonic anhydrase [Corynebacterium felinum]
MNDIARDPKAVWLGLLEGNRRFAEGVPVHPNQSVSRREQLQMGQAPRAAILTCGDSRVPVELLFDVGLGDLFVVRTAGEVVDSAVLASLEFAVAELGVEVLVVLGHESCGAVGATAKVVLDGEDVPIGHQRTIVEQIAPSILEAKSKGGHSAEHFERAHAHAILRKIMQVSPVINTAVDKGRTAVVAGRYRLKDGRVETVWTEGV